MEKSIPDSDIMHVLGLNEAKLIKTFKDALIFSFKNHLSMSDMILYLDRTYPDISKREIALIASKITQVLFPENEQALQVRFDLEILKAIGEL